MEWQLCHVLLAQYSNSANYKNDCAIDCFWIIWQYCWVVVYPLVVLLVSSRILETTAKWGKCRVAYVLCTVVDTHPMCEHSPILQYFANVAVVDVVVDLFPPNAYKTLLQRKLMSSVFKSTLSQTYCKRLSTLSYNISWVETSPKE